MDYLLAVNNKQLGICLRMLFAENLDYIVKTVLNSRNKIEFHISVDTDEQTFQMLRERYEILIS